MELVFCIAALLAVAAGKQSCYSCTGVSRKEDCNKVVECSTDEICFSRRTVSTTGNVTFDYGCLSNSECGTLSSSPVVGRKRGIRDSGRCIQCCDADAMGCTDQNSSSCGCNRDLCGLPENGEKICFSCDDVRHPSECTTTKSCFADEMCSTNQQAYDGHTIRYNLGCERKMVCSVYASQGDYPGRFCTKCCDTNFCNIALCGTHK
ncbi:uncharacterized protein LOC117314975 isoform X2 [Pecten maximus]|nr:uncharacterized protein LOC117314975 isoform X2 [Pecten maximus]